MSVFMFTHTDFPIFVPLGDGRCGNREPASAFIPFSVTVTATRPQTAASANQKMDTTSLFQNAGDLKRHWIIIEEHETDWERAGKKKISP